MAEAILKLCSACNRSKALDLYPVSSRSKDGRRPRCKECHNAANKAWREANPEKSTGSTDSWRRRNMEKARAKQRRWEAANPGRMAELARAYRLRNPESVQATYVKAIEARRYNPAWKVHHAIANGLRGQLRSKKGRSKTFEILGYTLQELMTHLERQFLNGMGWANYGEWHIDHVLPLSSFSITGIDDPELRIVWGLPNLRPLWAVDNLKKHAKKTHLI